MMILANRKGARNYGINLQDRCYDWKQIKILTSIYKSIGRKRNCKPIKNWVKDLYSSFTKDIQVTIKYMTTLSISVLPGKLKTKNTVKYHYRTNGIVKIIKIRSTKYWWEWSIWNFHTLYCKCKMVESLWKTFWHFSNKGNCSINQCLRKSLLGTPYME